MVPLGETPELAVNTPAVRVTIEPAVADDGALTWVVVEAVVMVIVSVGDTLAP
jgi:hypothetical protein